MHLEGRDCSTLTSPPMSNVVRHSPFPSPLCDLPLVKGSSYICSIKVSVNSNVMLSNIYYDSTSALAEDFDETASLNS